MERGICRNAKGKHRRREEDGAAPPVHDRQEEPQGQKEAEERQKGQDNPIRKVAQDILLEEERRPAAGDKIVSLEHTVGYLSGFPESGRVLTYGDNMLISSNEHCVCNQDLLPA